MLRLYSFATWLAGPVVKLYLQKRLKEGKEDPDRIQERLGFASKPRPKGPLIWVHAASVGEAVSVLLMIEKICKAYKVHVLLTTGTVTSAKLVEHRLPKRAFHQYVPVDNYKAVNRFLSHWQPDLALWVESELWPNLIAQTRRYCQMILVNARISDQSFTFWQRLKPVAEEMLRCFSLCLPQSERDAERLRRLGVQKLRYIGNLKCDAPPLPADPKKMGELVSMIGERPVWLATSTHEGEEKIIAAVHQALKEDHPELLTIIAPRHPDRAASIASMLQEKGLAVACRSKNEPITEQTAIYIADTMGELGIFYRLAAVVFVGGTLTPHGGQNPLEACRLECAIILGPSMENFADIAAELEQAGAVIRVENQKTLQRAVETLLFDPEKQDSYAQAALQLAQRKSGVLEAFQKEIYPFIDTITAKKHADKDAA